MAHKQGLLRIPLCPKLIKGSNVNLRTSVSLIVHDAIHAIYNSLPDKKEIDGICKSDRNRE